MKNTLFALMLPVMFQATAQTTTFDNLNANALSGKSINWTTSHYGSGFGHRIINDDPGGVTLLNFQGRHNSAVWSNIMSLTSDGKVGIGIIDPTQSLEVGGNIISTGSDSYISIAGTGLGNYQGGSLRLSASGINSGNEHAATWFMNHRGTDGVATFEFQRRNSSNFYRGTLMLYRDDHGWDFRTASTPSSTGVSTRLTIKNTGEVGVGTTDPQEKLHVSGNILGNKLLLNDPNNITDWNALWQSGFYESYNGTNVPEPNAWFWGLNMNHGGNSETYKYNGQIIIKNSSVTPVMYFRSTNADGIGTWAKVLHSEGDQTINGNLGIGTSNTQGFKLGVDGRIAATEVKVATYSNWPDFVFRDDYTLPTLREVENHIKEKGHLKDIPSAHGVKESGFYLAEMNAKLLQKIEELTLYVIHQEKKLEELKSLKEQNKELYDKFAALEILVSQITKNNKN